MAKIIEDEVVTALLNYLQHRPYAEVAGIMPILAQLKPLEPEKKD